MWNEFKIKLSPDVFVHCVQISAQYLLPLWKNKKKLFLIKMHLLSELPISTEKRQKFRPIKQNLTRFFVFFVIHSNCHHYSSDFQHHYHAFGEVMARCLLFSGKTWVCGLSEDIFLLRFQRSKPCRKRIFSLRYDRDCSLSQFLGGLNLFGGGLHSAGVYTVVLQFWCEFQPKQIIWWILKFSWFSKNHVSLILAISPCFASITSEFDL